MNFQLKKQKKCWGSPHGIVANMLDYGILVNKFKL